MEEDNIEKEDIEKERTKKTDSIVENTDSGDIIYQIFDKVFKKVITLSARSVINLINGLFDTDYPLDSTITYNWTEFEDDNLKRILADTILTINGEYSYHLEAQIEKDEDIVFRVFEYGNGHAMRNRIQEEGKYRLQFPRPVVIYLYYSGDVPNAYTLSLEFEEGKEVYEYKVPVLKLPEITSKELSERKMAILIPFHVLKLRYALKDKNQDLDELQSYILDDIIDCINKNLELGNITRDDGMKLKRYLHKLCKHLGTIHKELGRIQDMTDESFMTDIDIICEEHEKAMQALESQLNETKNQLNEKQSQLDEQQSRLDEKQSQLVASAKELFKSGMDIEEVQRITGVAKEFIK